MDLNQFLEKSEALKGEAGEKFGSLSSGQLNYKPNSDVWSVGQIIEHLIISNDLYLGNLSKVADGTHNDNGWSKIPFVTGLMGTMLRKGVSPESARKLKTFGIFEPSASDIADSVIEDFIDNQDRLISTIKALKPRDLAKRIATPVSKLLNIRVGDALEMLLLHEERHFLQADGVMNSDGFPE
ncbi:MAG: DinB family protein [Pyrinomonadaceae bacterium]|nr:DinB family protein [Pyrinomonadaceae bacterium]